jgi:hypothetical protein
MESTPTSVALDIGPGRGALVIYPDESYRGREIEISRVHASGKDPGPGRGHGPGHDHDHGHDHGHGSGRGPGRRVHTGVHERRTASRSLLTAIFGSLPAGDYLVWADADTRGPVVTVPEASVAEIQLSGAPAPSADRRAA